MLCEREFSGKPDAGNPLVRFEEGRGFGPAYSTITTGCFVAWMRRQNGLLKNARFASRGELRSTPGEVEKRHDGVFQQAASTLRSLIPCSQRLRTRA
jgi:hypothetical protein